MKKLIPFFLIIVFALLFNKPKIEKKEEFRGVFVSYIEISKYLKDKDETTSKNNINEIINKVKENKLNAIILQVRPSSDAIYPSKIFPISKYLSDNEQYSYDVLKYFIEESHKENIKLIAWVNPYRVSTTNSVESINKNNPAYDFLNTDKIYISDGIYYNPSKDEVNNLITEGIKEILEYNVDGILFDDYFYPDNDIDMKDYEEYKKKNNITKQEYNLMTINNLISKVHKICSEKNVMFGVSPEGNIENNYNKNFADVKRWLKEDEYVDFIMPQIYYGFNNSTKPYIDTLNEWIGLIENKKVKFIPTLALYKSNKEDYYAKEGKNEWIDNNDVIMKEIIIARNKSIYNGFSLFRYDNLIDENSKNEINNVKKILN